MGQVRDMAILCNKGRGDNLSFYIQAGNPMMQCIVDYSDKFLADAIESIFLLNTENAILMWNYISIPLSYKYDISYMMGDILKMLNVLQSKEKGELTIHWLPDTFRCDWTIWWDTKKINIHSHWENTVGHLEMLLNEKPNISLKKDDFIKEWKSILGIVISGLEKCGYDEKDIQGMKQLVKQYKGIIGNGMLYNN